MAFCTNCGQQLADGAKFCSACGHKVDESPVVNNGQRKTVYTGEIHKCPNCGEILNAFIVNCPVCGYELRGLKTNSPVEILAQKVEKASSLAEKNELIANFYIPNTKEDIYDFFILAVSNLEDKSYDTDDAWRTKLEQAYHKARLSFGNTAEFAYLDQLYIKTCKKVTKREQSISSVFRRHKVAFIISLLATVGLIMLVVGIVMIACEIWAGVFLLLMSISCLCFTPVISLLAEDEKKKTNGRKNKQSKDTTK